MPNFAQNIYLNWIALEDTNRQVQVRTFRDYYDGSQPTLLTDRQAEYLNIARNKSASVNVCAVVVDTLIERLEVTGFNVSAKQEAQPSQPPAVGQEVGADRATAIASLLDGWWADNRMDAVQGWVHQAAARDAESFVIVEWDEDEGRPYICHDFAYDGESGVKVHMKPGTYNRVAFASKRWRETNMAGETAIRLNMYFPNRIEKWVSPGGQSFRWEPFVADGLPLVTLKDETGQAYEAAVAWWTEDGTQASAALGVPVIPFVNRNDGAGRGMSEIDNAIPVQDAINKTFLDLMASADHTGFGMYWTSGQPPSGGFKVYPGAMLPVVARRDGETAQMGALPAGDLSGLINLWQSLIAVLSGITGTPQSRFSPSAVRPAEGTQQQEEGALLAKVKDRQKTWGNAWEDVMMMALKVAKASGADIPDTDGMTLSTIWAEAQTRNELDHLNSLAIKADKLAVPVEQLWSEAGYSAAEIRKFKADRAKAMATLKLADAKAKAKQPPPPPQQPPPNGNGNSPQGPPPPGGNGQGQPEPVTAGATA